MNTPSILISPADGLVDQRRRVVISGFSAGPVTLEAWLTHPDGSRWHSKAIFLAAQNAELDLDQATPIEGDWNIADASAFLWSMHPITPANHPELTEETGTWRIDVCAHNDRGEKAQVSFRDFFQSTHVSRQEITENGLVGTLFTPKSTGPHPAILVLNGSGGGIPRQRAALFAAHGFTAFALGYFKAPGLPQYISHTPLEYFGKALAWMHEKLQPKDDFVAVSGQSRGGELSLLLASKFPQEISAVAAYVPSSVIHGTLRAGAPGESPDSPAWTWKGKPLTNIWENNSDADWSAFRGIAQKSGPIRQAPSFVTAQKNAAATARARIPVENIRGPVVLICGTDDGFWPSVWYSQQIASTLKDHHHQAPVLVLTEKGAGHAIGIPFTPSTVIAKAHPVAKIVLTGGGTAQANAHASADSWPRVITFLRSAANLGEQ